MLRVTKRAWQLSCQAPVVTCLDVNAFNNVSVLSGNKTTVPAVAPINVKNNSLLNGILGGSQHGCGCN
jgi:hypothetical protein